MKKDWLDAVSVDSVRDFFTENVVDENSYVADVSFVKSDTRNNVVLVLTRNPFTKKVFKHFYDAFGVVYLDDEGMFRNEFKGSDLDDTLSAWYTFVSNANEGITIKNTTYRDDFNAHHSRMIDGYYNPSIKDLEGQLAKLKGSYYDANNALQRILGDAPVNSPENTVL